LWRRPRPKLGCGAKERKGNEMNFDVYFSLLSTILMKLHVRQFVYTNTITHKRNAPGRPYEHTIVVEITGIPREKYVEMVTNTKEKVFLLKAIYLWFI
jgi:hypothetical protein